MEKVLEFESSAWHGIAEANGERSTPNSQRSIPRNLVKRLALDVERSTSRRLPDPAFRSGRQNPVDRLRLLRMCYKISLLKYKAFPDALESVIIWDAVAKHFYIWAGILAVIYSAGATLRSGIGSPRCFFGKILWYRRRLFDPELGFSKHREVQ